MKKLLSVFLAFCLVFIGIAPIMVSAAKVSLPVIYVGGQEEFIYSDKTDAESKTYFTGDLPEKELDAVTAGLRPQLVSAIAGNWEAYLEGFYEAAIPYYSEIILDNDGLPINNTGYDCLKEETLVNKAVNGRYGLYDYKFIYDWRLDPCANAEELNDYVDAVLEVTGAEKVNIVAVGIGCSTVLAYMQAYGTEKISELVLDDAALNGSDVYGAYFCDDIKQDPDELAVFVAEARRNNQLLQMIKRNISPENWDSYLSVKATRAVYGKLYEITIPRIARAVYATMPGVWSLLSDAYYEDAIDTIFEDYEFAFENAILIEKLNNYHYNVGSKTQEILTAAVEDGVHVYNIVNYGFHMIPVNEKANKTSDVYISVESATLGATVADYGKTLIDEEADADADADAVEENPYLSPEKDIDASTGFQPDHTWFIKNLEYNQKPAVVDDLITAILNFNGYTNVFDIETCPQYLYCTNDGLELTALGDTIEDDTETPGSEDPSETRPSGLAGFFDFIRRIINTIVSFVRNVISYGQSKPFTGGGTQEPVTDPVTDPVVDPLP